MNVSDSSKPRIPLLVSVLITVFFIPLGGLVLDRLLGHGLSRFFQESPDALLVIFVATFGLSLVLQTYIFNRWENTDRKVGQIVDLLTPSNHTVGTRIVQYGEGYRQLSEWVREAKHSVLILNYSPDGGYNSGIQHIPDVIRKPLFEDYLIPINNPNVRFERIIQLENGDGEALGNLWDNLEKNHDQYTFQQCVLLAKRQTDTPSQKAYIKTSPVCIHSTFALVDATKLFLRLDYRRPQGDRYEKSLILLAEDSTGEAFRELMINYENISGHPNTQPVRPYHVNALV